MPSLNIKRFIFIASVKTREMEQWSLRWKTARAPCISRLYPSTGWNFTQYVQSIINNYDDQLPALRALRM